MIDYQQLNMYHILAFQQFVNKTNNRLNEIDSYLDEINDSNNYNLINDSVLYHDNEIKKLKEQNQLLVASNTLLNNKITSLDNQIESQGLIINQLQSLLLTLTKKIDDMSNNV
jgi:peptidoglycan hydrolase CwlO-like protein